MGFERCCLSFPKLTSEQSNRIFLVNFSKVQYLSNNFPEVRPILTKSEDKPNRSYALKNVTTTNYVSVEKNCGLLDSYLGTKVTTLMCGRSKLRSKQIGLMWTFLVSKVDKHTKASLS